MFFSIGGLVDGPLSAEAIRERIERGEFPAETLVADWRAGPYRPAAEVLPARQAIEATPAPPQSSPNLRTVISLVTLAAIGLAAWNYLQGPRFASDAEEKIAAQIRKEFEKTEGVKVVDIHLIRKDDREITGFAKLRIGDVDIVKDCRAPLGTDGRSFWRCQ